MIVFVFSVSLLAVPPEEDPVRRRPPAFNLPDLRFDLPF
jgi:hypothetical protein